MTESTTTHVGLCQCPNGIPADAGRPYIPPFYDNSILRAFYTPSKNEVRAIKNDLLERSAEQAALASEIDRLELLLRTSKDRHTRLIDSIAQARQFIIPSPIRRLPVEVLRTIFSNFCHTPIPGESKRYGIPITLAVVCSQWRNIVSKTPSLWTDIHLDRQRCSPAVVDHQLSLSAELPLIIHIEDIHQQRPTAGVHDIYEETEEYYKAVLIRVCQALPRWQDICLQMPHKYLGHFATVLEDAVQALYPQGQNSDDDRRSPITPKLLEAVGLIVPFVSDTPIILPKILESAPKLTTFRFSIQFGQVESGTTFWPVQGLPWTQLRTLRFEHSDLNVLDCLPAGLFSEGKTVELQLYVQHFIMPGAAGIVTNKFTTLRLAPNHWEAGLATYLEALSAPTLKEIDVGCAMMDAMGWRKTLDRQNNIGYPNILATLLAMITRSKCSITIFSFYWIGEGPEGEFDNSFARTIIALLHVMPDLETLDIHEAEERGPSLLSDPEFFVLCSAPEKGGLLTKLESLKLVWAADRQLSADLVPMLQSRMGRSALKSVVLGIRKGGNVQREVLDCMGQMRENGIRATLW